MKINDDGIFLKTIYYIRRLHYDLESKGKSYKHIDILSLLCRQTMPCFPS